MQGLALGMDHEIAADAFDLARPRLVLEEIRPRAIAFNGKNAASLALGLPDTCAVPKLADAGRSDQRIPQGRVNVLARHRGEVNPRTTVWTQAPSRLRVRHPPRPHEQQGVARAGLVAADRR